ncbi:MAG: hypothetical protein ACNA8W_03625 [Bradymonadaceae bacterium]
MNPVPTFFSFTLVVVAFGLMASTELSAQEAPYSPKKYDRAELISSGAFEKAPFTLPWKLVSTRLVTVRAQQDFEHVYDERFDVIVSELHDAFREGQEIIEADGKALGDSGLTHLRIIGTQIDQGKARFTLGQPGLSQHIVIDAEPRGRQTVITVRSSSFRMVYSGVVPARAPFTPAGAMAIPFRWN